MKGFAHIFRKAGCLVALAALAALTACNDDNDSPEVSAEPVDPVEETEKLGTYYFDGDEYPIYYACYAEDGNYTAFLFSPLKKSPLTTSISFSLSNTFLGEEWKVGALGIYHNDDYFLIYEDPVHYYSQYREPQSGTLLVVHDTAKGDNCFTVRIDVLLSDGTPLKLDFEGELPLRSELESE